MKEKYETHEKAWDTVFEVGKKISEPLLAETKEAIKSGKHPDTFMASLLDSGKLTDIEIISLLIEVMGAGVDSTATVVGWLIHHLARHPQVHIPSSLRFSPCHPIYV